MAGFNIGNIFGGLTNGLKRGLEQDLEFAKLEIKAFSTGDHALQAELDVVRKMWVQEVADEAGVLKGNIISLLLGGGDPFAGSRHAFQDLKKRHGL